MESESLQAALRFLESWLDYRARQVDIPGFCVAIYHKDSIVFSRAYGFADMELGQPMSKLSLFAMASQSKMFTATAALQLAEASKLRLDDYASDYVPWLHKHPDEQVGHTTIRQLLNHNAGLIRDGLRSDFWELQTPFPDRAALRRTVLSAGVAVEPNRNLKYSNLGYALLGQVVAAASGQSFTTYIKEGVIRPLELVSTYADFAPALEQKTATGYGALFNHERQALTARTSTKALAPAVGIHATTEDMCRFAAAHFFGNTRLLKDEIKKEAQRTQAVIVNGRDLSAEFGLGFRIQRLGARRLVGHDGHLAGHVSATFFDPDAHLAVAIAANAKGAPCLQMVNGIFRTIDWFAQNSSGPVPKNLERFNTRSHSMTSSVEIVATQKLLAAIDPDSWDPFGAIEKLEQVNTRTLRVVSANSMLQAGECISYTFDKDVVRAVRYAGLSMIPEAGYVGRALRDSGSTEPESQVTLDDLQHATLRIGRVLKVEICRGRLPLCLTIDFGPTVGTTKSYLQALPARHTKEHLLGSTVLGAVFPVWSFGATRNHVLAVGLSIASALPGKLTSLIPDPAYPRTFVASTVRMRCMQYAATLRREFFKLQALPEYPVEENIFGSDSLRAWNKGNYHKARALMKNYQAQRPYWLRSSSTNELRILITDEPLTNYQHWAIEFHKNTIIPMGETEYVLPRKTSRELALPEGDISIWDNTHVLVNGYADGHWTHTTDYNASADNNIDDFLKLKNSLLKLSVRYGQKIQV